MSLDKVIGGYFELELNSYRINHQDGVLLNSGRSCLEYIVSSKKISMVYLPKFICDAIVEPLIKKNIKYHFYKIDHNLEIDEPIELLDGEYILYVNYFGLKGDYIESISNKFDDRLILDLSQAFYYTPNMAKHFFYSPRKFFGLPDGGVVHTDLKPRDALRHDTLSFSRSNHLLKRLAFGAEEGYGDFLENEKSISGQEMMLMSSLTKKLLNNINFELALKKRNDNFDFLHNNLRRKNHFKIPDNARSGPMAYPYISDDSSLRQRLIEKKIFVPTYWPNVLDWCDSSELEYDITNSLIPLPIDQRYDIYDMEKIVGVINAS